MALTPSHRITICTSCGLQGENRKPGHALIGKLRAAVAAASGAISQRFEISGAACWAGCDRPCAVADHAPRKATFLSGDTDPEEDVEDLVSFARHDAALHDGWCSSMDRPGKPRRTALAGVPALVVAVDADTAPLR